MRRKNSIWLVVFSLLSACQILSGTDPLEIASKPNPIEADASTGGGGSTPPPKGGNGGTAGDMMADAGPLDAGPPDAGPDGGHCERAEGSECNWLEPCGCKEDEICQARGADAKGTCVKPGKRKLGETCKSPDECEEGTCDQRICRAYCTDRCDDGRCLPASGEGDKPLEGINVCWKSCQAGTDSCQSGTTCQTRDMNGTKAAFCLPPADPCPTTEDGKCDEPTLCAAGTDSVDCSCMKAEDAECNHVEQCGCPKGKSCELADSTHKPVCAVRDIPGLQVDELCATDQSCGKGLTCTFNPFGSCKKYCADSTDCAGPNDECVQVADRDGKDVPGFKICRTGCSDANPCPANNSCVKSETGAFCRPFEPEIPNASCNLTFQLGCDGMPGAACDISPQGSSYTAACVSHSGQLPAGSLCTGSASDCEAGTLCVGGVCRRYCDPELRTAETGAPGCSLSGTCSAPRLADSTSAPFNVCFASCAADSDCDTGLQCQLSSIGHPVCSVPMTSDCPTDNNRCDEPMPRGTGLCAPGFDSADCMVSP